MIRRLARCSGCCATKNWSIPANIEYEYKGGDSSQEVRRCLEYCRRGLNSIILAHDRNSSSRPCVTLGDRRECIRAPELTAAREGRGWKLLFDGKSLAGWQGTRRDDAGAGWKAVDGVLDARGGGRRHPDGRGVRRLRAAASSGRSPKGGNSGIFFRVVKDGDEPGHRARSIQVLDNAGHIATARTRSPQRDRTTPSIRR